VLRRPLVLAALAVAAVPAVAGADGYMPAAQVNVDLASPGGGLVVSTQVQARHTVVRAQRPGGRELGRRTLRGQYGVPVVTFPGQLAGFSADGRTVVLAWLPSRQPPLVSHLAVLDSTLHARPRLLTFRGDYSFDAISPHGRLLYLIQRLSRTNTYLYRVRVYDLAAGRLRPGAIVDRVEHEWKMQGIPLTRVTAPGARRVYTLYQTPKGGAFVHALDTVHATARCIDLPWKSTMNLWNLRLRLGAEGLTITESGHVVATIDPQTNRVVHADSRV
jgi:hypothetical protein